MLWGQFFNQMHHIQAQRKNDKLRWAEHKETDVHKERAALAKIGEIKLDLALVRAEKEAADALPPGSELNKFKWNPAAPHGGRFAKPGETFEIEHFKHL